MKPDRLREARRWLRQAENDLAAARSLVQGKFYAQACFMSQQAAEKALKALAYLKGERFVLGHSARDLVEQLSETYPALAPLRERAGRLDQYYVSTRYPNALPGSVPFEAYGSHQAEEAVGMAAGIITTAAHSISHD